MYMYYSCYICLFFCPGYHGNHFESNFFYTCTILGHLLFPGRFFFQYLRLLRIWWFMGCILSMCQKIARRAYVATRETCPDPSNDFIATEVEIVRLEVHSYFSFRIVKNMKNMKIPRFSLSYSLFPYFNLK
jgi:hypothetical protein